MMWQFVHRSAFGPRVNFPTLSLNFVKVKCDAAVAVELMLMDTRSTVESWKLRRPQRVMRPKLAKEKSKAAWSEGMERSDMWQSTTSTVVEESSWAKLMKIGR